MVVAGRLDWARFLMLQGLPAHICVGAASADGRAKVKIIIDHRGAATSPMARMLLVDTVDSIACRAKHVITVDRGHHHVSTDCSEISIWMSAYPVAGANHDNSQAPPAPDGPGDSDGFGGPGGGHSGRRRRGRSPPDPWYGPNNVDPWAASSSPTSPPHKAPRMQQSRSSWHQSMTASTAGNSSVTPEPPTLRCPQPARKGTPTIHESKYALGTDGQFELTGVWTPVAALRLRTAAIVSDERFIAEESFNELDWFDPFMLLESMALGPTASAGGNYPVICCDSADNHDVIDHVADSLLNSMRSKQAECKQMVAQTILNCSDDSWKLQHGDIVYVDLDMYPSIVLRNGYDQYEREVRVARVRENLSDWKTGRWVPTDLCFKLEVGDRLVVNDEIVDATENRRLIPKDTKCKYIGRDEDGDILIAIGKNKTKIIFKEDVDKLTLK